MTTPSPVTRCWVAMPREGDLYVGYVWAATEGKAKTLAYRTDPGHDPGFGSICDWRLRRRHALDGLQPPGAAWWHMGDVPPELSDSLPFRLWDNEDL